MQNQSTFKKEETHKKIDDTFNHIVKFMGNIFEKIKFNDVQILEETNNLEILTSTEALSNRLEEMNKIVNELKVEFLKKSSSDYEKKKERQMELDESMAEVAKKMLELQNLNDYSSNIIKDWKQTKFYKFAISNE